MVHGHFAEYKVLVDDEIVIDGGSLTALGVVPSREKVVEAVRTRLSQIAADRAREKIG